MGDELDASGIVARDRFYQQHRPYPAILQPADVGHRLLVPLGEEDAPDPVPQPPVYLPDAVLVGQVLEPVHRAVPGPGGGTAGPGLDLLGLDQMHLRQQLPATRVLEMLQSNRIDRHSHLRQVSDNPVCAGVDGLGDDKSAMALVELAGQFRPLLLPVGLLQSAYSTLIGIGDAGYLSEPQSLDPSRMLQGLGSDVPGSLAPLEFDDHEVPVPVHG